VVLGGEYQSGEDNWDFDEMEQIIMESRIKGSENKG